MNILSSYHAKRSYQNMSCGLNVDIQSPHWHSDFQQTLKSIRGIKCTIDAEKGTAIVEGRVNPYSILTKLKKIEKIAPLAWIKIGNHQKIWFSGYETDQYHHHQFPCHHRGGYWPQGGSLYDPYYGSSSSSYGSVAPYYEPYGYWPSTSGWRY